jgi:hypothetical protein
MGSTYYIQNISFPSKLMLNTFTFLFRDAGKTSFWPVKPKWSLNVNQNISDYHLLIKLYYRPSSKSPLSITELFYVHRQKKQL